MNRPHSSETSTQPQRSVNVTRSMTIFGAIAVGIGLVGFLVGIAERAIPARATPREAVASKQSDMIAPSYQKITSQTNGPNRNWASHLASLKQQRPDLFAAVVRTPELKEAALRDRLRTRAFDGAPPVVPHYVEQQSAQSCLVCHGEGLQLGSHIATKISHPHYANCLGCHVEQAGGLPSAAFAASVTPNSGHTPGPLSGNTFAGVLRAGPGTRAMPGAPPTIPHTVLLRSDCMSCHGLIARPGLRTTHPWLQNCLQCHASTAEHERFPFSNDATTTIVNSEAFSSSFHPSVNN